MGRKSLEQNYQKSSNSYSRYKMVFSTNIFFFFVAVIVLELECVAWASKKGLCFDGIYCLAGGDRINTIKLNVSRLRLISGREKHYADYKRQVTGWDASEALGMSILMRSGPWTFPRRGLAWVSWGSVTGRSLVESPCGCSWEVRPSGWRS